MKAAIAGGMDVDDFAGRLSFFFAIGMNFFMEVAKLRAARLLWHRIMTEFGAKKPTSLMLRTHCQTSGVSLQEQDPYNNVVRTAYEAMAAALGGTQSLHTNALDEAIALPTEFSARIARNTQLILQEETGITHVVDPLAGSYYVESLTAELADAAWALIEEVDALGGMTKAVVVGDAEAPDRGKRGAAAGGGRPRRGGDRRGQQVPAGGAGADRHPRRRQRAGARGAGGAAGGGSGRRATRRPARRRWPRSSGWRGEGGNLLAAAVEAARARASVGEISDAMEKVFGRHRAEVKTLAGVYGAAYEGDAGFAAIQGEVEAFAEAEGRRPRMLVVKMGQDGHDRGAKVIATAFADIGFDVDVGPLFQTPEEAAQDAIDNDVHVVGISRQAAGHKTLAPKLIEALKAQGAGDILVICGGVIPQQDYDFLKRGRRRGDLRAGDQHSRGGAGNPRADPAALASSARTPAGLVAFRRDRVMRAHPRTRRGLVARERSPAIARRKIRPGGGDQRHDRQQQRERPAGGARLPRVPEAREARDPRDQADGEPARPRARLRPASPRPASRSRPTRRAAARYTDARQPRRGGLERHRGARASATSARWPRSR